MEINKILINEVLNLMEQSSMNAQERAMWTVIVPTMPQNELLKFKTILTTEVEKLKIIKEKITNSNNA